MIFNKKSVNFIFGILFLFFSCHSNQKFEIEVIDSYVDTSFGLGDYLVYVSDTNWERIIAFSDSLDRSHNKNNRCFVAIDFCYPKQSIPRFKKDDPYTITYISNEKNHVIARYYDTSHVYPPILERYPDNFKKAKEYEKQKSK